VLTDALRRNEITMSDVKATPGIKTQVVMLVGNEGEAHPPPSETLRASIIEQGGTFEVLESGQILTLFSGSGDPQEEAGRAARMALRIRATLAPEVPMTLVCDCSLTPDVEILIERGVRSIHQESMELVIDSTRPFLEPRIRLDAQTEQLLITRFPVRRKTKAAYLYA
jgi:hypothetical protein